jgi:hypothetical protein
MWNSVASLQRAMDTFALFSAVLGAFTAGCALAIFPIRLRIDTLKQRADVIASASTAASIFASQGLPADNEQVVREAIDGIKAQTAKMRSRGVSEEEIARTVEPFRQGAIVELISDVIAVNSPGPPIVDREKVQVVYDDLRAPLDSYNRAEFVKREKAHGLYKPEMEAKLDRLERFMRDGK